MLHILLARAVLDTSPWRVEVDPDWVVADGVTTVTLWLQSPNTPIQPTAVELRDALDSRLKQNSTLSLSPTEKGRVTPRSARAAAFVNATFGAPNCAETSPSPPPPSPANPPPSLSLPPSLPPSTFDDTAVIDVTVELYDSFSDGWGSLRLVLSTLPGVAMERSFSLAAGPSSARETFSLALGCYSLQLHLNGEPLASTSVGASSSEAAVSEARWRLLGCPVAAPSRLYRAGETAIACVTADAGGGEASCALLADPAPPPSPPLPSPPPAAPTPLRFSISATIHFWSPDTLEAFRAVSGGSRRRSLQSNTGFEDSLLGMVPCDAPTCTLVLSVLNATDPSAPQYAGEAASGKGLGSGADAPPVHAIAISATFTLATDAGGLCSAYASLISALVTLSGYSLALLSVMLVFPINGVAVATGNSTEGPCAPLPPPHGLPYQPPPSFSPPRPSPPLPSPPPPYN